MNAGNISCEEVIEQLFRYLDGEVDDIVDERIQAHMARCRDCFSRAEFERRLRERVREANESPAPERVRHRIRQVLDSF